MTNQEQAESNIYSIGRYIYSEIHYCKRNHRGFWHKIFCYPMEVSTTTANCDDYWSKKVVTYRCGYEIEIYRSKDDKRK